MALFAGFVVRDSGPQLPVETNPENPTSEANGDVNVVIIQDEEPVAVAANSGVVSPLDKRSRTACNGQQIRLFASRRRCEKPYLLPKDANARRLGFYGIYGIHVESMVPA
jgi:hypothetical protein